MQRWAMGTILFICFAGTSGAQQDVYVPTKSEHAQLTREREKIVALQDKITKLQAEQNYEIQLLGQHARDISEKHHWPISVQFNGTSFGIPAQPQSPPSGLPPNVNPPAMPQQQQQPGARPDRP